MITFKNGKCYVRLALFQEYDIPVIELHEDDMKCVIECPYCHERTTVGETIMMSGFVGCPNCYFVEGGLRETVEWYRENDYKEYTSGNFYKKGLEKRRNKMKIEVGTKLTVRSDLNENMNVKFGVNKEMAVFAGKTATVTNVVGAKIKIDLDHGEYNWSLNMFYEFVTWLKNVLDKHKKWLRNEEGGERAYLRNAYLRNADLRNADLHNAYLRNADLRNADLHNADLRNADLRNADLHNADLRNANLHNADLRNANLCNADLCNADDEDVKIKKVMFVGPVGSRDDTTQIFFTTENKILIKCGCFYNYIDEFERAVHEEHEGTRYEKQYMAMIELAKIMNEEK